MFKTCNTCSKKWSSREEFLGDPDTAIVGYQSSPLGPDQGFFYINHDRPACHTTLAIKVIEFTDLYDGPLLEKHRIGAEPCPQHCYYTGNLSDRPEACECRYVRTLFKKIKQWPKQKE